MNTTGFGGPLEPMFTSMLMPGDDEMLFATKMSSNPSWLISMKSASELESSMAGREKADLVFLRDNGTPWTKGNIRLPIRAAIKHAKLDPKTCFYTLRHTFISHQLNAAVPTLAIAQNVGTGVAQIEKHYGKFLADDRRAMLERGQIKLQASGSNVVNFG